MVELDENNNVERATPPTKRRLIVSFAIKILHIISGCVLFWFQDTSQPFHWSPSDGFCWNLFQFMKTSHGAVLMTSISYSLMLLSTLLLITVPRSSRFVMIFCLFYYEKILDLLIVKRLSPFRHQAAKDPFPGWLNWSVDLTAMVCFVEFAIKACDYHYDRQEEAEAEVGVNPEPEVRQAHEHQN